MRRVVVTGMGIVSCLGDVADTVSRALQELKSGIRAIPDYAARGLRSQVAGAPQVGLDAAIDRKLRRFMGDAAAYAYLAMRAAIADAGLGRDEVSHPRTGVVAGSVIGDRVESSANPPAMQTVRSCGTAYSTQNRVVGYNVEYEYRGQHYTTQTQSPPGKRIALNVQVEPADAAPPAQQAPAEAASPAYYAAPGYAPAPVVYAPQPYYAPYYYGYGAPVVVHLGYGWYGGRHWH